jgi:hypothetical protein
MTDALAELGAQASEEVRALALQALAGLAATAPEAAAALAAAIEDGALAGRVEARIAAALRRTLDGAGEAVSRMEELAALLPAEARAPALAILERLHGLVPHASEMLPALTTLTEALLGEITAALGGEAPETTSVPMPAGLWSVLGQLFPRR